MKLISRKETEAVTANPTPQILGGFDVEAEMREAAKAAVAPLKKRLNDYRREVARLEAVIGRWSDEACRARVNEITGRAAAGDESAALLIESGQLPSPQAYRDARARAEAELDRFTRNSAGIFAEAAAALESPVQAVVDRGQTLLDTVCDKMKIPRYQLHGQRNAVAFAINQLQAAARNESADLSFLWDAVGG